MDIRHLEALRAVAEEGSFTAAADRLHTVQSNVSEQVRQLEAELGVQLIVRDRRGAVPTEFGVRVLDRARAIRSEIDALRLDLSMLQGLDVGHATLGVVGTISSVARAATRRRARRRRARRLAAPDRGRVGAPRGRGRRSANSRPRSSPNPSTTRGSSFEHLRDEALVGLSRPSVELGVAEPVPLAALAGQRPDPAARGQPAARRGRRRGDAPST